MTEMRTPPVRYVALDGTVTPGICATCRYGVDRRGALRGTCNKLDAVILDATEPPCDGYSWEHPPTMKRTLRKIAWDWRYPDTELGAGWLPRREFFALRRRQRIERWKERLALRLGRRAVSMNDDGDRVVTREAFGRQVVVSVEEDAE